MTDSLDCGDMPELPEQITLASLFAGAISPENRLTDDERDTSFRRDHTPAEPIHFGE
ncbi:hypothetical protein IU469_31950 [Nocardia puris]|uniref:Uncharacterized protein n=1 Tax=Nocardia puris TaxID=208602 RepID=A0A366CSX0_9NOCA|nr:hypothetical protein [Nocardia puris]MBF6215934.1 hypothetical protein [Nocardia puris]MBF6370286.1 hypothetical protein [Nocardia puris]RBO78295.1 hypothetical protein DFR74_1572 [Nocardia puris]